MKNLLIILDPAHGEEVPGKRSPDGQHREYKWSRERIAALTPRLNELGYQVEFTSQETYEIGLSKRRQAGTDIAKSNLGKVSLLISIHNDAKNDDGTWQKSASGISIWTSKGRTTSDLFADIFLNNLNEHLPDVRKRIYTPRQGEQSFEANFTVLLGTYSAILIECMFQDNQDDVEKLANPTFCKHVEDWIISSIEQCEEFVTNKLKS